MGHLQTSKTGTHTTIYGAKAAELIRHLDANPAVSKISIGKVETRPQRSSNGQTKFKLTIWKACLHIQFSQGKTVQQYYVYVVDGKSQEIIVYAARFVRNNGWKLCFGKHHQK